MIIFPADWSSANKLFSVASFSTALLLAAVITTAVPAGAQTNSRVTTVETTTDEPSPARAEGLQAPAASDQATVGGSMAADAEDGSAPSGSSNDSRSEGADNSVVATPIQAESGGETIAPSFLDDPAGAVSHLLNAERQSGLPHDLSPWGMFMAADWVVKAVMIGLALGSLGVWTVWAAKTIEIACAKARAKRGVAVIASAATLADAAQTLSGRGGPAAFMVRSAEHELQRSSTVLDHAGTDGVKERLGARLARIEAQAGRRLSRGTGLLATVGSTAPFIGLFGTVWGIMNSFIGISQANTTNLAVVAPGIAEALLATAIGLVAAIPAVIVYNVFARSIAGYGQLLADAGSGVEQLVSLDLDLRKVPVRTKSLALTPDSVPVSPSMRALEAAATAAE